MGIVLRNEYCHWRIISSIPDRIGRLHEPSYLQDMHGSGLRGWQYRRTMQSEEAAKKTKMPRSQFRAWKEMHVSRQSKRPSSRSRSGHCPVIVPHPATPHHRRFPPQATFQVLQRYFPRTPTVLYVRWTPHGFRLAVSFLSMTVNCTD